MMMSLSPPLQTLQIVPRSKFAFKTDIAPSDRDSHNSGVIHAVKIEEGGRPRREEHAFAWIDDRSRAGAVEGVVRHLARFGFDGSRALFVPYSSCENWVHCYPHACPYMKCNAEGTIKGIPCFSQCINSNESGGPAHARSTANSRPNKRRKRGSGGNSAKPKMFPSAALSDEERSQLHVEIYDYFAWLCAELAEAERTHAGRSRARRAGISVPGMRNLLAKLEGTFRNVGELRKQKKEKESVDDDGGEGGDAGNNVSGGTDDVNMGGDDAAEDEKENKEPSAQQLPLLERIMGGDLRDVIEERQTKNNNSQATPASAPPSKPRDFDVMFEHLLAYRERTGDVQVPFKYVWATGTPDRVCLGSWVGDLRRSWRDLRSRGLECEPENELAEFTVSNERRIGLSLTFSEYLPGARIAAIHPSCPFGDQIKVGDRLLQIDGSNVMKGEDLERGREKESRVFGISSGRILSSTFLSAARVARLDAIGFIWEAKKTVPRPWEERLAQVKQFKETHGKWPSQREKWESIGEWVHQQRKSYAQRDERFMAERYPRLEEIGFPFEFRKSSGFTMWDDRLQQLVEFHRVNRHFNVPLPEENGEDGEGVSEALRFYRWVKLLDTEYAHYQNGRKGQGILNKDRVSQLLELGFQFDGRTEDGNKVAIPDVPFGRRLEQLRKCQQELGHFRIDNRYTKMDNIGGWAHEISKRHRDWRERKAEISPLEEDQFRQLGDMGFQFDVFAQVRTKRSWQENFDAFLVFQAKYGHSNVPHKYKGDMRLGKWVNIQRNNYKLRLEGKPSKLTQEKQDKLENAGFVWWPETSRSVLPE